MDFLTLSKERYSVRDFAPTPIEKDKLDKILECAMLAPTGCNFQPQRILVISEKNALKKLDECTKYRFNAPTCICVCFNKDECWTRKHDDKTCGEVDASIVTAHIMFRAWELGIGSTWVMSFNPFKLREYFNIPDNLEPIALLPIGYPAKDVQPSALHFKSKAVEDVVFYDKF